MLPDPKMIADRLWANARLMTMAGGTLGIIEPGIVATRNGRIVFAGSAIEAPAIKAGEVIDCAGRWISPGLIDCHTHLIHGGDRAQEFEQRLLGATYTEIAKAGGGILSTMRATRACDQAGLVAGALPRLDALIAEGVTTIEIKSGYGLESATEARMLRAARQLGTERSIRVHSSFLGAHALPPEFSGRADAYIDHLVSEMLPMIVDEGLADSVDGFCEGIGFSADQVAKILAAARRYGLPVRLHAEQLSNLGGAAVAASYGALSADHLEYLDEAGIAAMRDAGTVAVLLPGAFYFTHETKLPPIAALRTAGVPIAIATDCNPGTSPITSLLTIMNMAATLFRLTVEECLIGATANAAKALGLDDGTGTLAIGAPGDLAIWNIDHPAELVYRMGFNPLHMRIFAGEITTRRA